MSGDAVYQYNAEVVRWVDGDTVDLRVDLGFRMWAETRFRLYGIDTPERGQPGWAEATDFAKTAAPAGSHVVIQTWKDSDKYGRWLVEVFVGDISVNGWMLDAGVAREYLPLS